MTEQLRHELETVGLRLSDTWEALVVEMRINELGSSTPGLQDALDKHGHFWHATLMALQTAWFTGVFSLLDKDESSATLYGTLKEIRKSNNDPVFAAMEPRLDAVRDRYKNFRHKLFGHNDKHRQTFIELFDQEGFTWRQCGEDMLLLDYVWKAIWFANEGELIPTEDEARERCFPHNTWVLNVVTHTDALLYKLIAPSTVQQG